MKRFIAFLMACVMTIPMLCSPVLAASTDVVETVAVAVPSISHLGNTKGKGLQVAHMGYSGVAPGNTKAAFCEAGKAGFWGAEADVRATKDGVLICLHDETVDGMTNGSGAAYKQNWSKVKKYKINAGRNWEKYGTQHICKFSEYLDICKDYGMVAVIDIKWSSEKAVRNMYKMVKDKGMLDQAIFQCSVQDYLKYIKQESDKAVKADPDLPKATMWYLVNTISKTNIKTADKLGCAGINGTNKLSKSLVTYAHKRDVKVGYYLIFSQSETKTFKKYGTDFLMSNYHWD